jgi:single-strand DNA-binding protein
MPVTIAFEGNLTRDPELRYTPGGAAVCNFAVAVNKRLKVENEWVDGPASFYNVAAWRQLAEDAAGLSRGQKVVVIGQLEVRQYDRQDGLEVHRATSVDVTADAIGKSILFSSRSESDG